MAKILCTGSHLALIELRKAVLEGAGHTVVTIVEPGDVAAVCNDTSFDVAIIGQSIGPESRGATASAIRHYCASVKFLSCIPGIRARASRMPMRGWKHRFWRGTLCSVLQNCQTLISPMAWRSSER